MLKAKRMSDASFPAIDATALDVDALMKRCLGRIDLVEKVLGRFAEEFTDELEALEQALANEDFEAIGTIAHRVKGASLTVSANTLSERAAALEKAVNDAQTNGLKDGVDQMRSEWNRVQDQLSLIDTETKS